MSLLQSIFGGRADRQRLDPLYRAIIAEARDPAWYREGQVPDTIDGRFDMVAALAALVLLRLEREDSARGKSVHLTELFVDDMEGTIRQIGIGDLVVGKHLGKMMGALGGRLAAFRDSPGSEAPVLRNIFHDSPPSPDALRFVTERIERFRDGLERTSLDALLAGELRSP